jgi:hypothetical protein
MPEPVQKQKHGGVRWFAAGRGDRGRWGAEDFGRGGGGDGERVANAADGRSGARGAAAL